MHRLPTRGTRAALRASLALLLWCAAAQAARAADESVTRWTYDDLWRESRRYAKGFLATGVGRGTRVGVLAPNSPDWLAVAFGVAMSGGVLVPFSTFATGEELAATIREKYATPTAVVERVRKLMPSE